MVIERKKHIDDVIISSATALSFLVGSRCHFLEHTDAVLSSSATALTCSVRVSAIALSTVNAPLLSLSRAYQRRPCLERNRAVRVLALIALSLS